MPPERHTFNRAYVNDDVIQMLIKTLIENLNKLANYSLQQTQGQQKFKLFNSSTMEIESEVATLVEKSTLVCKKDQ